MHFTAALTAAGQGQSTLSEASTSHALEVLRYQKLYVCTYLQHVGALLQIPGVWEGGVSVVRASQGGVGSRMPRALAADPAGLEAFPTKSKWRVWDIVVLGERDAVLGESDAAAGDPAAAATTVRQASLSPPAPPVVFATMDELLGGDDEEADGDGHGDGHAEGRAEGGNDSGAHVDKAAVADTSAVERELCEEVGDGPVLSRAALKTLLLACPDLADMQDRVMEACDASFDVSGMV